jgi:apolipoprotein N-acyltransferase
MYEPFTEGYLLGRIPVYDKTTTIYTRFGDWFAWLCLVLAAGSLAAGLCLRRIFFARMALTTTRKYRTIEKP